MGTGARALGHENTTGGERGRAFGWRNGASGTRRTALGYNSTAAGYQSLASGVKAEATGYEAIAIGRDASVLAEGATGFTATGGIAFGAKALVEIDATNAVAIGAQSVASEANTVSFGDTDNERRLVHVAAGTTATDAVNVSQLYDMGSTVASYFGGGAAFANGAWTAPVYVIQGGSHGNVGDAFAAVDGALSTLDTRDRKSTR